MMTQPRGLTLDIEMGDVFIFPEGRFTFLQELPDANMLLQKLRTNLMKTISEEEFVEGLEKGSIKPTRVRRTSKGAIQPQYEELPPGEEGTSRVKEAETKQFFARKWDELHLTKTGTKFMQRFMEDHAAEAEAKGFIFPVSARALGKAIRERGVPGDRPLAVFLSQRGQGPRNRLPVDLAALYALCVDFFYDRRERDYVLSFAHFRTQLRKLNDRRILAGQPTYPLPEKMETLRRKINAAECFETWARKYSVHEAYLKFKGTVEHMTASEPGELVIIDHTTADDWVLLDDAGLPLGPPTLTIAVDVFSRMPLGFVLSAEPASLHNIGAVLRHAQMPKTYVRQAYPEITNTWNAWGRIQQLLVDNAWEIGSKSTVDALSDIGIEIFFALPKTPQQKSIGERVFDTLNKRLFHRLPGAKPYDVTTARKARYNPQDTMYITLKDLEYFVHAYFIDDYQMAIHDIVGVPARKYEEGIATHKRRIDYETDALDRMTGQVATATLRRNGINFKGMRFHDEVLTGQLLDDNHHLMPKRQRGKKTYSPASARVKIKYHPSDATRIFVWNEGGDPKEYITLPNVREGVYRGMSFWAAAKMLEHAKQLDLDFSDPQALYEARDSLRQEWEALAQKTPRRLGRDARRGIAAEAPTLIEGMVLRQEAPASVDGMEQPAEEGIPVSLNAQIRTNADKPMKNPVRGGRKTTEKAMKTRAANKKAALPAPSAAAPRNNDDDDEIYLPPSKSTATRGAGFGDASKH